MAKLHPLDWAAQKEREKKEEKQQSNQDKKVNQGNKGRVETPAPTQKKTNVHPLDWAAQKEREKQTGNVREEVDLRRYLPATTAPTRTVSTELNEIVASIASKREELTARLEAARQREVEASHAQLLAANEAMRTNDPTKARGYADAVKAASDEYNAIKRELDQLDYLEKYKDKTFEDTFSGQFGANKTLGRLGQDTSAAYNEYLQNPTEANRAYADALDLLTEHFQVQNKEALDDVNAKATWITQDLAQNLPQRWDQIKAGAAGAAAVGLPLALVNPGLGVTGAKWGATAAVGAQSYNQMRGAAFQTLLNAGIDEEIARAAAGDEAVLSALAEMADTAWTIGSSGVGAVAKAFGKGGTKAVAGEATKVGSTMLAKALAKYGINIPQEILEEGFQQTVSIANLQRTQRGETGFWNLVEETGDVAWDAITGENKEARDEIVDAGWAGGKLAIMMGGVNYATDVALETGIRSHIGKKYSDAESVQALIESGLESAEGTESRKLAEKLQAKKQAGKTISNAEVGALQQANVAAIEAEQNAQPAEVTEEPQETLERLAKETVEGQSETAQSEDMGQESSAQKVSVPYNVMSADNPVRQQHIAESKNLERKLGYGQEGMKAFNDILETSNNTVDQVRQEFQAAYEAGKTDLPREKVGVLDGVRETAYNAGRMDYILTQKTDAARAQGVTINSKAGFDPADMSTDNLPQGVKPAARPADVTDFQVKTVDALAKKLGVNVRIVTGIKGNAEIRGNTVLISADFNRQQAGQNRSIVFYAAHEIGMHRLMKLAPAEGRAFVNAIIQEANAGLPANMTTETEQRQADYGEQNVYLSIADAMEEVAADKILELYDSDEAFAAALDRILNGKDEKAKQGARKFKDILDDIVRKLKDAIAKLTGKEKTEAKQTLAEVEQLRDMWEKALQAGANKAKDLQATKNAAQESDVVQHSIDPAFAQQILSWDGKSKQVFTLGTTSDVLKSIGVRDSEIRLNSGKARDILTNPDHDMDRATLAKIPEVLEYPIAILKSQQITKENAKSNDGNTSRLVIFGTIEDTKGVPVAVVLELLPVQGGKALELSIVASAYGKTSHLSGFVQSSDVLYLDPNKKRTNSWLQSVGVQFPSDAINYGSMGMVTYSNGKVNIQGVPFSQISGATYIAAPKQSAPMADWQKKLAELHSKMTESEDDGSQKSLKVTDKKTLDFLNEQIERGEYDPDKNPNGGYIKVYRSFQVIDGKLYAPMNAVDRDTDGKNHRLGYNSQYRVWEMATESPEIAQRYMDANPGAPYAKFDLDGVDNKTGGVAYNPYLHASNLVLNDQFSAAYRRNLITVECYVPVSEANGAYKAQYAKDATGWVEWKPGGVAGKLMKQKPEYTRKLFVSRYMLPVREVKAPELASMYKEYLDGTNIKVPWNVVTPELRRELVKAGVGIDYKDVYQSTDKKTGEKKYAKFDEVFPGERQYSLKDNYGRTLSKEQQEFFKDSKVRDEQGNLLTVYHGTEGGGFTKFEKTDDIGYFFARSLSVAYTYSGGGDEFAPAKLKSWDEAVKLAEENDMTLEQNDDGDWVLSDGWDESTWGENELQDVADEILSIAGDIGRTNYEVYLNIKNPLIVDGKGANWDNITGAEHQHHIEIDANEMTVVIRDRTTDEVVHDLEFDDYEDLFQKLVDIYGNDGEAIDHIMWLARNEIDFSDLESGGYFEDDVDIDDGGYFAEARTTRQWVQDAVDMGCDGVIFRNIVDEGKYGRGYGNETDVFVALKPEQIKSVNNTKPTSDPDIRYSLKDSSGRELTKEQTGYFKNSKIRDKKGNLKVVYHGSGAKFTKFSYDFMSSHGSSEGQGFYFTDKKEMAQGYEQDGGQLLEGYLNITKPLSDSKVTIKKAELTKLLKAVDPTGDDVIINYDPSGGMGYPSKTWYNRALAGTVAQMMEYNESDSEILADIANSGAGSEVVLQKVRELLGYDGYIVEGKYDEAAVYVAFTSEQFKNVDNLKPTSDPDIRYSLKNQDDLMRQNAKLKEVNQELQAQFKTTKFAKVDKKALRQFAKQLLKDYQSGADIDETRDALDGVFTYIANGENGESPVWQVAYERAYDTAVSILSNSSVLNDEMFQAYKELRDTLKNTGITIDKNWDNSLMGYESINEFRKHNYGRIKLVNDGVPVDLMYQELAWKYPEFFDSDSYTNQADQLSHIEEVLNSLQPTEVNPYSHNMREAATWLANDIMERFFELPQAKPTFADKAQQKLTKQVIKDHEKLERVREQKNERIAKLIEERREKVKEVTRKEKEKREQKVREIKDRYKAKEAKMSESRKASVLRARIVRHVQDMSQTLLHPTDKRHVPEALRKSVAAVLDAINLESQYTIDPVTGKRSKTDGGDPTKRTQAFNELRKAYQDIIKDDSADIAVDPAMEAMLDLAIDLQDVKLADMNLSQLQTVWNVVRVVEHTIHTAGKLLSETKYERTVEWADAMVKDTKTRRSKKGSKAEALRIDMENPYTFFSHYGESGKAVFRMLRDAQDKQQRMVETVRDKVRDIVDPKTVRKLEKEVHTLTTESGDQLILTTAQIMDIYLLTKRQQAHDHLLKGGIVQPEVKAKKIKRGTDAILLTAKDLADIVGKLDAQQREIANKLQEMTRTTLADYGNEASLKAYGYKKFTGSDYWPIKSAREGVHSNVEKGGNNTRSIKNIGLAKTVMPHANNPLDIGGVFQTFASHAADMTDYAAWLCPMEDANRLFNFQFRDDMGQRTGKTIKGMLDRVGGKGAQQYWHNLMEDIQNGIKSQSDTAVMGVINTVYGNTKGASVAWNIRVIVQQPTAILRAAAVLSPADMAAGLVSGGGWKAALAHSAIAQRKDMGGFDISSPAQMNDILYDSKTPLERFNEAGMWGAGKADALTWGRIWNACEHAVKRERSDLVPKTDEFYEAVNELFTEVIDQSQVVDGVLQRSHVMRSNNAVANQATSFMGEPLMALNMLLRAYDGLVNETDKSKRSQAFKTFGRATSALLITNVVNALAQSLVDAARDDEDDEYWEKVLTAFTGITGEEETAKDKVKNVVLEGNLVGGVNPVGYIPFVKDFLSIASGYSVQRADAAIMEDLWHAVTNFFASWNGDGKKTKGNSLLNLGKQVGKVFGVGAGNLTRDIYAALRTAAIETGNIPAQYELEKWIYKVDNQKNGNRFMDILYKSYREDKDAFKKIYGEMLKGDYFESVNDEGEVTTTSDYIANKLKKPLMDDLFELYKNDQAAYKAMYNDLLKRDFLHTGVKNKDPDLDTFVSTEEAIASAMESRMKKDQGVKKVGDLEQRYLTPSQQPAWDSSMKTIQSSGLWKSATEKQRDELEADLYDLVTGNTSGTKMRETIDAGKSYGLDDTEYLLWQLALDMNDKPSATGSMGSYTNAEKADAVIAVQNMGDSEKAYLWSTTTTSDEVLDAFAAGVDIDTYALFKAGVSELEAGVDYVKGDTESRKRAINKLLKEIGASGSTKTWLYHTEYKK